MMINCPKCGFLQDKDQYCAQCGINMKSWKPPRTPALKKLVSNWMFQLGILFIIIFFVVMKDSFTRHAPGETNLPPVENQIARSDQDNFRQERVETVESASFAMTDKKNQPKNVAESQVQQPEKKTSLLKKQASIRLFSISRAALFKILPSSRKVEEGVFVVTRETYSDFRKNNTPDIRSMGGSKVPFQFGQLTDIFLTEEDLETGVRLGFFTQLNIEANSTPEGVYGEARFWHSLKLNDEPSPPLTSDFSMRKQDVLFIVDPSVHDYEFNEEERHLFEASRRLQYLNNELFVEALYDIVLVVNIE